MISRLLIVAGCATALSLMPVMSSGLDLTPAGISIHAHAKNGGNGGGNSGGNGGGSHGGGGGNAGGNSGQASSAGGHGSSKASAETAERGGGQSRGKPQNLVGEFIGNLVGGGRGAKGGKDQAAKSSVSPSAGKPHGAGIAAVSRAPKEAKLKQVPIPQPRPDRPLNFHAKLAGLNSLNRNYHAYLNSNDPKMAAIQDYVMASVGYEKAAEELEALQAELEAATEAFDPLVSGISAHDDFTYEGKSAEELQARLDTLQTIDTTEFTEDEIATLETELQSLEAALASEEFAALEAAQIEMTEAEVAVGALEGAITDDELTQALLAGANPNRIEQYGEGNYVDQEMLDWAKDLLGVGDAEGKIDEIRAALESGEPTDEELVASE